MAEIDSIEIKISASAEQANKAIRNLTRSLGALSSALKFDTSSIEKLGKINGNNFKKLGEGLQAFANAARSLQGVDGGNFEKLSQGLSKIASIDSSKLEALGKIDGNSFRGLGEGVKALSAGLKDLQGVKKTDFNKLASGIERLGAIQPGNMETVGKALRPLADGINILNNARFDNKNLQNLINSLTRLANANVSGLSNVDFTALGNSIKGLATALSGADKVEQNTISMVNAIAKLATAGANISATTSELPLFGEKLKEFMHTLSGAAKIRDDTIAFTQAIGTLASAGSRIKSVADNLVPLGEQLRKLFEIMSKAPTVSDNVIKMVQALAQLAGAGGRANISANALNRSIGSLSISMSGLRGSTMKAIKGLESFGKQVLSAMGVTLGIYGAIRGIKKSIEISSALTEVQNVVDVTFQDMAYKVEEFAATSIEQLGMSELSVKQYASRFQAMGVAMGINSSLISDSNGRLSEMTNGYVEASGSMADVSLNLTKLTADLASFYDVEQKAVAEDLAAIFTGQTRPLRDYGIDLTQATLQEWALKHGLDANMKTMSQAEKTMLRYQYVMANTAAAHGDFARTADTWSNQIRILKQNFEQLGKVIGTSFIGFLKPLVQSLNVAISYITAFAETVSNSLGKIFGWKYEKSTGAGGLAGLVGDATDLEDGIGGATDAAKKLKTVVLGIDELNINAPDEGDKGGGTAGAGLGAGGMLGEEAGKWVKDEALLDYESELDTLYKLGTYIGETLSKAMESIDWDSVYQSARNFGTGLAEFLNGLISPTLFANIGKTIAGALNTALHFLDSFGEKFDFANFGNSLAAGLISFLNNIQWETALSAASNWGKGIGNALNAFITPETFGTVGSAIANALNVAVQFVLDLGTTLDFYQFGESVSTGINEFFEKFDFKKLAQTLNTWVDNLWDFIKGIIDGLEWEDIWNGVKDFFSNLELDTITVIVGAIAWKFGIGAVIKETLKGLILKAIGTITTPIKAVAKIAWTGITTAASSLATSLGAAWTSLGGLGGILTTDVATIAGAGTLTEIGLTMGIGIGGGVAAAIGGWHLGQWLNEAITGEEIDMSWAEQFDEIKNSFSDGSWSGALKLWAEDINTNLSAMGKDINAWLEDTFGDWAGTTFSDLGNDIKSWWNTDIKGALSLWKQDISDFWEESIAPWFTEEKWSEFGENIKSGISTKWSEFTGWWTTTGFYTWWVESVSPWFTFEKWYELGQGILEGLMLKWEEVKTWWNESAIVVWWEENVAPWFTIKKWSETANGIKEGIAQKWIETSTQWKTNITKWWNEHVSPWFTKKRWEELLKEIPNVFKNAFKNAANGAIGFLNGVIEGVEKMVNNAIKSLADMARVINKIPGVNIQFETPNISLPRIPQFANGGITLNHTFAEIGELNRPEAILPLSDARAMGMIADSIMENTDYGCSAGNGMLEGNQIEEAIRKGVRDAVAEILTPYLADIAQNTRETADKDMSVNLDGRDLINELDKKNQSLGFDFRTGNSRGRVAF